MSVKNKLVTKANTVAETAGKNREPRSMKDWIIAMEPQIAKALPSVITPERFTRMALTAVSSDPKLAECTPQSFLGAMMNAAQLGLEPNTPLGQAYLIPFRNKGRMEVQYQTGYKGLIELAHRSGEFKSIEARVVYENDEFEYEYGLNPKLVHKPAMQNRGEAICYYAVYTLVNGGFGFEVLSKEDIRRHAETYSQSFGSGYSPWKTAFDEMAKKTAIKRVLKYAPIKTEFARALITDGTIRMDYSSDLEEATFEKVLIEEAKVVEMEEAEQPAGQEEKKEEGLKTSRKDAPPDPQEPTEEEKAAILAAEMAEAEADKAAMEKEMETVQ